MIKLEITHFRFPVLVMAFFIALTFVQAQGVDDFRAVYGVWNYSILGELGFDAVYQEVWWTEGEEKALELFANESDKASEHGLSLICGPYYEVTEPEFNYSRAVNANGHVESVTPSRVDPIYWKRLIEEPGVAIANLSLSHDIWGVVWDIEDYRREEFTYWDYTFDQYALQRFGNETDRTIPSLPPSERRGWLSQNGLLEEFQDWQERTVIGYARETQRKIHTINPDLHLGILAFEDGSWFHLSILKGLSTEGKTVTAWHEDTYSGYKKGKVDDNHQLFHEMGINGKVLPGMWTLWIAPFDILDYMEYGTRHNGAFWIYQRATNPWTLAPEAHYAKAFRLLQSQVHFNDTAPPNPIQPFFVYPGIEVRANIGPGVASAVFNPNVNTSSGEALPPKLGLAFSPLQLSPAMGPFKYMGRNMSTTTIEGDVLNLEDLPCFVWDLSEEELRAMESWGPIHELSDLLEYYGQLGLGQLNSARIAYERAIEEFGEGRYKNAGQLAGNATKNGYQVVLDQVWPYVEQGFENPRNSSVPMIILNKIYSADRSFKEGNEIQGRFHLLKALKDWSEIPEFGGYGLATSILALLAILLRAPFRVGSDSPSIDR